jgi:soluble lytic murein transglycosylase-like protein
MARRLAPKIPDWPTRRDFLITVQYEASRAGLDPQLVLGLIQHESNFRKFAVSPADARGYMQVMPFWVDLIGTAQHNLFNLRTNLRYGCMILRHYLDIERGDTYRALARYNGSLGTKSDYAVRVMRAWQTLWIFPGEPAKRGRISKSAPTRYRGESR